MAKRKPRQAESVAQVPPPTPPRRRPALSLTGRSEANDPGAKAIQTLQRAHYTKNRISFDPFDAMAKDREAEYGHAEGMALLIPPEGQAIVQGAGEAMLPDLAHGGLTQEQRSLELNLVDTLEHPTMIGLGASQLRMEAVAKLGILQPAMDAAESAQAGNSFEKMLTHQMAALHHASMDLLARASGSNALAEPDPVLRTRFMNTAFRGMDCYREHMLALLKFKTGGKQTVVVQHVHVSDGGQALVAGSLTKGGDAGGGGVDRK